MQEWLTVDLKSINLKFQMMEIISVSDFENYRRKPVGTKLYDAALKVLLACRRCMQSI